MFVLQFPLTAMITSSGWTLLVATTTALLVVSTPAVGPLGDPVRELPHEAADPGHRLRVLHLGRGVRRILALPQPAPGGAGHRMGVQHLHHGAVRLHRNRLHVHAGDQGNPSRGRLIRRHRGSYPHTAPPEADPTSLVYSPGRRACSAEAGAPPASAGGELLLVHQEIENTVRDVEPDLVAVAHERDGSGIDGFGGDVADAQSGGAAGEAASVSSSTSLPRPAPLIAAVMASISRIPGPPLGPS